MEKEDLSNKIVIIGDSMINNINNRGLSKTKKVNVLNFPGATSTNILTNIDDVLEKNPESIIIHVGTNDFTNDVNLLSNVKKIVSKTNRKDKIKNIFRKDKRNIEKTRADTNSRLKNFCKQKILNYYQMTILKKNIWELKNFTQTEKVIVFLPIICYNL